RRRHTRSKRDWSSDVCSSDLHTGEERRGAKDSEVQERLLQRALTLRETKAKDQRGRNSDSDNHPVDGPVRELLDEEHKGNQQDRSEERRVGKRGSSRWWRRTG